MKRWALALAVGLMHVAGPHATTVTPVAFAELVEQAETIFVGDVVDTRSIWETHGSVRHIATIVTFDVVRVVKGQLGLRTELNFAGGIIGEDSELIAGMPQFHVGDRDVLFVSADRQTISPLVGFWHGRYRIFRDPASGEQWVRAHDGSPVLGGLDMRRAGPSSLPLSRPLSVSQFEAMVRERMAARRPR